MLASSSNIISVHESIQNSRELSSSAEQSSAAVDLDQFVVEVRLNVKSFVCFFNDIEENSGGSNVGLGDLERVADSVEEELQVLGSGHEEHVHGLLVAAGAQLHLKSGLLLLSLEISLVVGGFLVVESTRDRGDVVSDVGEQLLGVQVSQGVVNSLQVLKGDDFQSCALSKVRSSVWNAQLDIVQVSIGQVGASVHSFPIVHGRETEQSGQSDVEVDEALVVDGVLGECVGQEGAVERVSSE